MGKGGSGERERKRSETEIERRGRDGEKVEVEVIKRKRTGAMVIRLMIAFTCKHSSTYAPVFCGRVSLSFPLPSFSFLFRPLPGYMKKKKQKT